MKNTTRKRGKKHHSNSGRGYRLFRFFEGHTYRRRLRNLSLAFLVVLGTLLSFFAVIAFQKLSEMTSIASGGIITHPVNFDNRATLLLGEVEDFSNPTSLITNLLILTMEFSSRKASVVRVPVDLNVSNLAGFGENKLQSLFGLVNLSQSKDYGLIGSEVQNALSLPIDGFLLIDNEGRVRLQENLGDDLGFSRLTKGDFLFFLRQAPLLPGLVLHSRTDLTLSGLLHIFYKTIQSRFNKFGFVDLATFSGGDYSDIFLDSRIEEEKKSVIVLNGTKIPQLASKAGRLITNVGGRVLDATNAPGNRYIKNILFSASKDSYTVNRLIEIFKVEDIRQMASMEEDPHLKAFMRADIVLILGLDVSPSK